MLNLGFIFSHNLFLSGKRSALRSAPAERFPSFSWYLDSYLNEMIFLDPSGGNSYAARVQTGKGKEGSPIRCIMAIFCFSAEML
jgi:hypothetical protein